MMNIIAIALVAGIAYLWMVRGYFSAVLHMCCVLVAGAIAFGLWEPLALLILEKAPERGFLTVLRDSAWAIGLVAPFALSLAILRPVVDKLLPLNAQVDTLVNYIGGGACGAVSGLITAGIIIMGIGMLRLDANLWGYQPITIGSKGSIERSGKLILPVDTLVAKLYGHLSVNTLSTNEPLAKWYPDLETIPGALRMTAGEGKDRNTLAPKDVNVYSRYALGKGRPGGTPTLTDLLRDKWAAGGSQQAVDIDGNSYPSESHIEGFVVQFNAGAREKHGTIVVGNAQVRLLIEDKSDPTAPSYRTIYPVAVATRAVADQLMFGRFRLDAPVFIGAPGAGADTRMAFEFIIPPRFEPVAIYVKNARLRLTPIVKEYATTDQRDDAILKGEIFGMVAPVVPIASPGPGPGPGRGPGRGPSDPSDFGLTLDNRIGKTIQKGQERQLELDGNSVMDGTSKFTPAELSLGTAITRELRVEKFLVTPDASIVKIDVGADSASSILGKTKALAEALMPPYIVDTNGTRYQAVGYVYEDQSIVEVRFTPGNPLRGLTELPVRLSRSRTDQKCTLIFRVNTGVQINRFMLGEEVVTEFGPFEVITQRN
jgi:hypothetical protein